MVKMTVNKTFLIILLLLTAAWESAVGVCAEKKESNLLEGTAAESVYVCELTTEQCISAYNEEKVLPMGHLAKLMTVLICAEEIEKGTVRLDEKTVASANANAMPSPQIWLEAGDRITVEELLKSIIIGNANDACAALAEKLSGSMEKHTERMNVRAKELGMVNTHFDDCVGLSENTVSTAKDLSILSKNLVIHNNLTDYFTTWIDTVKCQAVELVNTNRLVRTYKGMIGLKFCVGKDGKCSLIAAAKRGNMTACVISLGNASKDSTFSCASNILDTVFENYRIYIPETDELIPKDILVINGRRSKISVKSNNFIGILVRQGEASKIEYKTELCESVSAPVKEGTELGRIVYSLDGEDILEVRICAAETVEKMDFLYAVYCCLCNLCNI